VQVIPAVRVLRVQLVIQARLEVGLLRAIPVMLVVLVLTALLVTRALLERAQHLATPEMLVVLALMRSLAQSLRYVARQSPQMAHCAHCSAVDYEYLKRWPKSLSRSRAMPTASRMH